MRQSMRPKRRVSSGRLLQGAENGKEVEIAFQLNTANRATDPLLRQREQHLEAGSTKKVSAQAHGGDQQLHVDKAS